MSRTTEAAAELLDGYARRTGLAGDASPPRRYLWTDALAVHALLALHRRTGEVSWRELALRLVDQVHETLGRHRPDDARSGWISGLDEAEGRAHPTRAGLRIGKSLPERRPEEPLDERLEWERDGQYFHYLTKWMRALALVARRTGESRYLEQAVELALAAHAGFVVDGERAPRMVWKASIDLTRPLVPSTGAHDPLDGLLTLRGLVHATARAGSGSGADALARPIDDFRAMCTPRAWPTADPLGIGGLLADAHRVAQLSRTDPVDDRMLRPLLAVATSGLVAFLESGLLDRPLGERLAFRELGLAIGLHALDRLARLVARYAEWRALTGGARNALVSLRGVVPLARTLEATWRSALTAPGRSDDDHADIDAVTLAVSLVPAGLLSS